MEDTAITCADSVEVTAMKVIKRVATAPPFPATAIAAYGNASPLVTSELVII
jgi:hypothetical protein